MQRTQKFTNSSDSVIKLMGRFSKLSRVLNVTEEGKNPGGEIDPGACVEQKGMYREEQMDLLFSSKTLTTKLLQVNSNTSTPRKSVIKQTQLSAHK